MLLYEFFQYLSQGELSQYAIGTENSGRIAEKDYEKVITHLNMGLTNLHSRLPLKQAQVIIRLSSNQTTYTLPVENVLKIEEVYTEDGTAQVINNPANPDSYYTPSYNKLQVPNPTDGAVIAVLYRANHPRIPVARGIDPKSIELDLTDVLVEPLLAYVMSRVMQSRGTAESINEANAMMQRYEFLLQQFQQSGSVSVDMPTNMKLRDNGWV